MTRLAAELDISTPSICYECYLAEDNPRVDLAFPLFPGFDAHGSTAKDAISSPALSPCLPFLKAWQRPGSTLWPRIPFVWLAFDLDEPREVLPVPSLGLCVEQDFLFRRMGMDVPPRASDVKGLASRCFAELLDATPPQALQRRLQTCEDAAAAIGVRPKHVSIMFSREPQSFKLDVELPLERVGGFLRALGYDGHAQRAQRAISSLMGWTPKFVQLNLALHPELSPRLEVELLTLPNEASPERRRDLLQRLGAMGLVANDKAMALQDMARHPHVHEGGHLLARSWYLKVRFSEDGPSEAKAYVGMMRRQRAG